MATITIDPSLLRHAESYARERNESLTEIVENYLRNLMPAKRNGKSKTVKTYPISPTFTKWEQEYKCSENIPLDYSAEFHDNLSSKYR